MGGSGGGSGFTATSSSVRERSREAHDTADQAAFESDINGFLEEKLKGYNSRDANLVRARLDEILGVLGEKVEDSLQTLFGGSVANIPT
jgi:hypothetical protein